MNPVYLIAAVGRNGALGLDGRLPWHDREDLSFFKFMTMGHVVLVGWRTAQTLPKLPGRHVVVDDRDKPPETVLAEISEAHPGSHIYVAGGAKTYLRYRAHIRRSFITHIDHEGEADTFMPALW